MKFLLSVVLLGCISMIQGQFWPPPNPLPVADPACLPPSCQLLVHLEILWPQTDASFFWQCGGNGTHMVLNTLQCPPFQFFTFATQRCEFIEDFIPLCTNTVTIQPPPVSTPVTLPTTQATPPVTVPTTPPATLPTTSLVNPTTAPPNNNCPCPCPCFPWFPCQPCQANCGCQG